MKTSTYLIIAVVVVVGGYFLLHRSSDSALPSPTVTGTPLPTVTGAKPSPTPLKTVRATPKPSPTTTPGLIPHVSAISRVNIQSTAYDTPAVTVTQGDVVEFHNTDSGLHTVTSDNASFDSGNIDPGHYYTLATANLKPGTYTYHDNFHDSMHGTIIVK